MNRRVYRLTDRLRRLIRRASLGIDERGTLVQLIVITELDLEALGEPYPYSLDDRDILVSLCQCGKPIPIGL